MDYTIHGILQARILEWVDFPFSRDSTQPRDGTHVSNKAGRFFTNWATGFPSGSDGKASAHNVGRPGFHPWVGKIPWGRKWQPTPVPLPGKSHRQRSLIGYSPWGRKESDTTEWLHFTYSSRKGFQQVRMSLWNLAQSSAWCFWFSCFKLYKFPPAHCLFPSEFFKFSAINFSSGASFKYISSSLGNFWGWWIPSPSCYGNGPMSAYTSQNLLDCAL